MRNFWEGKKVLITGSRGFVGKHVVKQLDLSKAEIYTSDYNLMDYYNCQDMASKAECIIHLAGKIGGIEYNLNNQLAQFGYNLRLATNMLDAAEEAGILNFLLVSSACIYGDDACIPFMESNIGLEPSFANSGYGWAKRMSEWYGAQMGINWHRGGMKVSIARPFNAYGPGDCFEDSRSHLVAALIKRVLTTEGPLVVWGNPDYTRTLLYVEDMAQGLLEIAKAGYPGTINLGPEEYYTIKQIAELILKACDQEGREIIWKNSDMSGQKHRQCDTKLLKELTGFSCKTSLSDGIRKTVEWYKQCM